jgi:activator of HSP90 ATPase
MDIHQTITIDCPAHAVYQAFTDEDEHAEITGAPASIDPTVGGAYSAYNDELTGEFTRLVPDELIVMEWRAEMEGWPPDHYAIASIELIQSSDGTTVEFILTDVPPDCVEAVDEGWRDYYWEPMGRYFAW